MNTQQVKQLELGDNVLVRGVVERVGIGDILIEFKLSTSETTCVWVSMEDVGAAWAVPSNPPSSPTPCTSKYDPCRWFKKGDKVRVVDYKGRRIGINGSVVVVEKDENVRENKVLVRHDVGGLWWIDAAYLELVTPVDELEPYFLFEDTYSWQVKKGNKLCARFGKLTHPHAKAAAEAECKRLNEEYRKEQNNG